jgi:hypothetical protein
MAKAVSVPHSWRPEPFRTAGASDGFPFGAALFASDAEFGTTPLPLPVLAPPYPGRAGHYRPTMREQLRSELEGGAMTDGLRLAIADNVAEAVQCGPHSEIAIVLAADWPNLDAYPSLRRVHAIMQAVRGEPAATAREILNPPEGTGDVDLMYRGCPQPTAEDVAALGGWAPNWWTVVRAGAYLLVAYGEGG